MLSSLLTALSASTETLALLDTRMPTPVGMSDSIRVIRVKPSVNGRLKAERWLVDSVHPGDVILCFGNLPPLFKLSGHTVVFLQNRYLVDRVRLNDFPLKIRVRLSIERLWLTNRMSNADEFLVQTPTMKNLLEVKSKKKVPVRVLPFITQSFGYVHQVARAIDELEISCEFLYVASGEPHKNHWRLIEAWCLLAEEGLFPSLTLTLDETLFSTLCREIYEMCKLHGLKLKNIGKLSHSDVLSLYKEVDALIYPSTFESFGLPLIEAVQAGVSVLAPELDYVRDVCSPEQTFDPTSPVSIARAVKRFLALCEPALHLRSPQEFWRELLGATSE